ncbi:helix-turn-helix domain-containing protein [Tichowtungia aerotolerans]|uniref:Helix-turn-helix domain-containing protein n=1 Tax=Tichowtungia aerotolerans TaxID=2697043 RepID=A0A6P1MFC2_9BACT|nr:helix-turn-helix domain-containing protein [Tichowtungia aerotolerans]QHI70708.1 helix-turn-helix domain-containing protein [Tichowtungia aerotolerans]
MSEILEKQDYFEDPTLPIQIHLRDPQPEFPLHSHHFDELIIILKGTAMHIVDGQPFPVKSGDVFVVSGAHKHQYLEMHGLALANILFDSNALGMNQWDIRALPGFHALFELEPALRTQQKFNSRLQLNAKQLNIAHDGLRELQRETAEKSPGYRVMAKGLFMQLVVFLSRCYSDTPPEESLDLLRLGDALAHIETHYAEKITLEDLARKAHLSPRHFQRIFHDCVGRSPIDYLMHIRVSKSALLLLSTNRTITDIALDCGFSDSNYFTRQFRKIMELTPGQYRKNSPR